MDNARIRNLKWIGLLTGLLVLILAGTALAGDLPEVQEIIDDYIEATGGKKAYLAHDSMTVTGTFEMPAMGLTAPLVMYQAQPNLTYMKIESAAIGSIESGSKGDVYWEKSMMGGAKIKDGEEKAMAERTSNSRLWLNWQDYYTGGEVTGTEEVEGHTCYKLVMTPKVGKPETSWWDTESKLMIKSSMVMSNEMGDISLDAYPMDYTKMGDITMALTAKQVLMGVQEMYLKMETVEWDKDIPAGTFDIPVEVQALLDAE